MWFQPLVPILKAVTPPARVKGKPGTGEPKPTQQEEAILKHIKEHGETLPNFLSKVLSRPFEGSNKHQFVLIGETHLKNESTPSTFVSSLPQLKREIQERGENLIIAVEITNPNLIYALEKISDYSKSDNEIYSKIANECVQRDLKDNNIQDLAMAQNLATGLVKLLREDSLLKVYIGARRNGIKVICPDKRKRGFLDVNSESEQKAMANIITDLQPNTRVICYGGSLHISKHPVTINNKQPAIKTLGTWLTEKFGDKAVISIRTANYDRGFDSRPIEASVAPRVDKFMSKHNFRNPIIAPCTGALDFNGNKNPYNYHHDYVFIDPAKKETE